MKQAPRKYFEEQGQEKAELRFMAAAKESRSHHQQTGQHLMHNICQNIETSLQVESERNSSLTDANWALALDRAKIAVKQHYGYAANESSYVNAELQGIVDGCVAIAAERIPPPAQRQKSFWR